MKATSNQRILAKTALIQADQLTKEGQFEKALSLYLEVIKVVPNSVPALTQLSVIYTNLKQWEQVIDTCQHLIGLRPRNMRYYLTLAQGFKEQGDNNNTILTYQKAISLNLKLPIRIYLELGDLLELQNKLEEQISVYIQAIESWPNFQKTYQKLAHAIVQQGSIEVLTKLGDRSETISFYRKLLILPFFLESNTAAVEKIHSDLGFLILQQSVRWGEFNEAVTFLKEACEVQPKNPWYHYNLGKFRYRQGNVDAAINCYLKAIELRQNFVEAYIELGATLTKKKEWDAAFDSYLKAIQVKSDHHLANKHLNIYFSRIERHLSSEEVEAKIEAYHKALDKTLLPQSNSINFVRQGMALSQSGKLSEAIELNQKTCLAIFQKFRPDYVQEYWTQGKLIGPSFFVIGVRKCGTTALYDYIVKNPKILPSIIKEPNAAGLDQKAKNFAEKINYYLSFFPPLPETRDFITGEASTAYIASSLALSNLLKHFPKAKLIVILRNPVKRIISQYYFQLKHELIQNKSLEKIIISEIKITKTKIDLAKKIQTARSSDFLIHGLYVYFLEKWMSIFPREQFLILRNEDLSQDPAAVMRQVFEFLEVPDYQDIQYTRKNTTTYPSQIDESLLTRLQEFYRPHNQRLEEFLGRKFSWD